MTVKNGLLTILSLGPLYGLQLRDEFVARAPHRARINVGQVYGTLERLRRDGLIMSAGETHDNLPLYRPTSLGTEAIDRWSSEAEHSSVFDWNDMLDQVLIVSSLPGAPWRVLIDSYLERARHVPSLETLGTPSQARAAHGAQTMIEDAAEAWLLHLRDEFEENDPAAPLSMLRPRRGRRPSLAV